MMRDLHSSICAALAIALAGTALGLAGCEQRGDQASKAPASPPAGTATAPAPASPAATPPPTAATPSTAERSAAAAGQAIDDAALTTKVKSALLADDKVKGLNINVDTNDGVVTLTGKAGSPEEKDQALKVVRGIEGVKNVQDRIAVN
jgi:hyperosmotically inducible periplasmic protein